MDQRGQDQQKERGERAPPVFGGRISRSSFMGLNEGNGQKRRSKNVGESGEQKKAKQSRPKRTKKRTPEVGVTLL